MSRSQAVKSKTSGEHIDLAGAVIPYTDLSDTNLAFANLDGTNFSHADLSGTDLSGASLVGAVLKHANLSNADLSRANLCRADLAGADLTDANLTGANLNQANLVNTKLRGVDLTHTVNTTWHQLLDAYIDENTKLPKDLGVESFYETLESYFSGFDLKADFGDVYDNYVDHLSKLIELAGEKTVLEFVRTAQMGLMLKEHSAAGLGDEPGEYTDE